MDINEGKKENSRNEGANSFFAYYWEVNMEKLLYVMVLVMSIIYGVIAFVIMLFMLLLGAWIALKIIGSVMAKNRNIEQEYREMKRTLTKQKPAKRLLCSGIVLSVIVGSYYNALFVMTFLSNLEYGMLFVEQFAPIVSLLLPVIAFIFFARGIYINAKCIKMIKRKK